MLATHAVGIDLGTTYSCLAYLNEHGEPVSIANPEGEMSTPSAVFFDQGEAIVGTEALRHAVIHPDRVVQNAKRYMGDPSKTWTIDGKTYTPTDISAIILKHLLQTAEKQLDKIKQAVITVPAQFSDAQRQATIEAGKQAGLQHIDIINEPVAAALCYVLGTEGLWFTELANEQRILVYDLGGGTFDLSLVSYKQDEVKVIASTGDLHLGGIDWNQTLLNAVAARFKKDTGKDPRDDSQSLQSLYLEVEQAKRSLTVRPKTAMVIQHAGHRKTYTVAVEEFNQLTAPLVLKTEEITKQLLKDNKMGWAKVDVVLTTGGSSRMPMIKDMLKRLSGRTLNTTLSPDQSIAHGATYYAGMVISKSEFVKSILTEEVSSRLKKVRQQSVTARGLGILIRDTEANKRVAHYLIQANTPLPAAITQTFGTVVDNQKRVHLHIVESGERPDLPYVDLGNCVIEDLPPNLPKDSGIAVTISYDASARVHVSAQDVTSGKQATTEIIRKENLAERDLAQEDDVHIELGAEPVKNAAEATLVTKSRPAAPAKPTPATKPAPSAPGGPARAAAGGPARPAPQSAGGGLQPAARKATDSAATGKPPAKTRPTADDLESAEVPIALCEKCGEVLNSRGVCPNCPPAPKAAPRPAEPPAAKPAAKAAPPAKPASRADIPVSKPTVKPASGARPAVKPAPSAAPVPPKAPAAPPVLNDDDVIDLFMDDEPPKPVKKPPIPLKPGSKPGAKPNPPPTGKKRPTSYLDED